MPEAELIRLLIYLSISGILAGLLSGLFGIGGGVVLVPMMIWLFSISGFAADSIAHLAIATSLATIIPTSLSSATAHYRLRALKISEVMSIAPWMFAGGLIGSYIAGYLPGQYLKSMFAIYLLLVAFKMWTQNKPAQYIKQMNKSVLSVAGMLIGTISALLGIGGGTLTVPFLNYYGFDMRHAVAISAACGIPIALAGSLGYAFLTSTHSDLPQYTLGYIYVPAFLTIIATSVFVAPLAARLAKRLPVKLFKRLFALFLLIIAIKLIL